MYVIPKKRGGRREGAGRKSKTGEATTVKRIPVSLIPTVDAMIASTLRQSLMLLTISILTNTLLQTRLPLSQHVPAAIPCSTRASVKMIL